MEDQLDVITSEQQREIEEAMQKRVAEGLAKIKEYLDMQSNTSINIAIAGECGSGKSTFVNAFRGIQNSNEEAAPTGAVETTTEVKPYPHPKYPNVTLWDLPGVGTAKFPADKYLELVGFEKFDFFIIISATRFKENDVKLVQEIKRMGKMFYLLRSKIDSDLYNEERSQKSFDREKTLKDIKENCIKGLRDQGIEAPQAFLVSSFELHQFDFHLLEETLEKDLPAHKRNAFLYAMPKISVDIIKKKKDAYKALNKYYAALSSIGAATLIPGLSFVVDLALVTKVVEKYVAGFGLDENSLKRLADSSGVPYSSLVSVMTSELGATTITSELIQKLLSPLGAETTLKAAAEKASKFFLSIGVPGYTTYRVLNFLLDLIADDAQKVFEKAVKQTT